MNNCKTFSTKVYFKKLLWSSKKCYFNKSIPFLPLFFCNSIIWVQCKKYKTRKINSKRKIRMFHSKNIEIDLIVLILLDSPQ